MIVQCRTWLNGLPPVWSVFWVTPPGGQAGESRWFTITPERPGLRAQQKGKAPQAVAGWQRRAALPHALHQTLWLESILNLGRKQLFSGHSAPAQAELPPLNHVPRASALRRWRRWRITSGNSKSPRSPRSPRATTRAPGPHPLPDLLLSSLPHRHGVSRRMRRCRSLPLGWASSFWRWRCFGFLYQQLQRLVRSVGDHLAVYHRLSGTPPTPKLQAQQRLRADSRLLDDWLRRGSRCVIGWGCIRGRLIPFVEAAINDWAPPLPPRPVIKQVVQGRRRSASIAWRCSIPANRR